MGGSHAPRPAASPPARPTAAAPGPVPDTDTDARLAPLLAAARAARGQAHAPYSRFAVGAAVMDEHGRIHAGCNVENAAYPEGLCAEAGAIAAMVLAGGRRITACAVAAESTEPVTPCGGCRQKLREFATGDTPVWVADGSALRAAFTLAGLLPASFGPDHLGSVVPAPLPAGMARR